MTIPPLANTLTFDSCIIHKWIECTEIPAKKERIWKVKKKISKNLFETSMFYGLQGLVKYMAHLIAW